MDKLVQWVRHRIDGLETDDIAHQHAFCVRHRIDGLEININLSLYPQLVRHRIDGLENRFIA